MEMLESHPHTYVKGEILTFIENSERNKTANQFFNSQECKARTSCAFRIPYNVFIEWNAVGYAIARRDISLVLVHRLNKVNHWLSYETTKQLIARKHSARDAYHCHEGSKCHMDNETFTVDPVEALSMMRTLKTKDESISWELTKSPVRWRSFIYEDIMLSGFAPILSFMGVEEFDAKLSSSLVKRTTRSLCEVINHCDSFISVVKQSPFKWDLDYCFETMGLHC